MSAVSSVTTRESKRVAGEINSALDERDVQGLAFIALSTAAGVVLAQEIADRVLPLLGFAREPTDATGFAVSAVVKLAVAVLVAPLLAGSGLVAVVGAFLSLGHVVSSGADLFNAVQRTGFLAESPHGMSPSPTSGNEATAVSTDGGVDMAEDCACDTASEPVTDGGFEAAPGPVPTGERTAVAAGW